MKINIDEIAERLDMLFDDWLYFLDIRTGEILEMEEQYFRIAEEIEDDEIDRYSNWEKENIKEAIKFYKEDTGT